MNNNQAKSLLILEYGKICFLGGIITKNNILTYHHLEKKSLGGKATFDNGALLTQIKHTMFNTIEKHNQHKANEINDYFRYFKETKDMKAREQMIKYVEELIYRLGYKVEERKNILILTKM